MKIKIMALILVFTFIFAGCTNVSETSKMKKITTVGRYVGMEKDKFLNLDVMDESYNYSKFEITDDIKANIEKEKYKENILVAINFVLEEGKKIPVITKIEKIDKAQIKATFNGMQDENFGEFKIGEKIFVFRISDDLKETFNNLKEGSSMNLTIKPSDIEQGNMMVIKIDKY